MKSEKEISFYQISIVRVSLEVSLGGGIAREVDNFDCLLLPKERKEVM